MISLTSDSFGTILSKWFTFGCIFSYILTWHAFFCFVILSIWDYLFQQDVKAKESMHVQRFTKKQIASGFFWIIFLRLLDIMLANIGQNSAFSIFKRRFLFKSAKAMQKLMVKLISTFFVLHFYSVSKNWGVTLCRK